MRPVLRVAISVVFAVVIAGATTSSQQQQPAQQAPVPATGFILGRTIDATTGKPLAGAQVSLNSSVVTPPLAPGAPPATLSRFPMRIVSDGNGAFVFRELPAGLYSISATRPGYASTALGRNSAADTGSQLMQVADGEKRGNVTLRFWKYGSISGVVRDEANEPIVGIQLRVFRKAIVGGRLRLTSFGNMPTTDDRGFYRAGELTPGDYIVGVITTQATVPLSMQETFEASVKDGSSSEFRRQIDRSGSSGLGGLSFSGGRRIGSLLLQADTGFGSATLTNPSGDDGRVFVYPSTFYPSAHAIANAMVLTVEAGEDRSATDFHLTPVLTTRVSGRLVGGDGEAPNTALSLLPVGTDDAQRDYDLSTATTFADANGEFTFLGVPSGDYTIRVLKIPPRPVLTQSSMTTVIQTANGGMISSGGGPMPPPPIPPEPTWWAIAPVSVGDREVSGLTVTLRQGARLSGHLVFDGAAERPAEDRLRLAMVQFERADARMSSFNQFTLQRAVVEADGRFKTYQLPPGKYVVRALGIPNWNLRSAVVNGKDAADAPFEVADDEIANIVVTFTDKTTELSGSVRNAKGPDSNGTVLLFPADSSMWIDQGPTPRRFRTARAGIDGAFRFTAIAAGDYLLIAIPGGTPSDWQDRRYLQKLAAVATRLNVTEGEKKRQDVETKEVRR